MQYFGGKQKIAKELAICINTLVSNPTIYLEPFCGSCNVGQFIKAKRRIFCDINKPLISMWKELIKGWEPPDNISESEYQLAKLGKVEPHLTAFIGFGCSFAGKYFGGYARGDNGRNYALNAKRSLLKKVNLLHGNSEFYCCDNQKSLSKVPFELAYCDPPYNGTTKYYGTPNFDTEKFWKFLGGASKHPIFISEYTAPAGTEEIMRIETKTDIATKTGKSVRIEKLYRV